ncbi:MAG TPA: hypothetical protein VJX67_13285 [Blastocatellia bacterium]|nr:hypothetical protein [Blastocatellia bacterium]
MGILASVMVDGGLFLDSTGKQSGAWEMGYYQCDPSLADMRIYVDGEEIPIDPAQPNAVFKMGGGNAKIEITHTRNGKPESGVVKRTSIDQYLLRLDDLHGVQVTPDAGCFDSIIKFNSGAFRCSSVKRRYFKKYDAATGLLSTLPADRKLHPVPVGHDVVANYDLSAGDELKITRDGILIWSSTCLLAPTDRLDIEILADDSTSVKYYYECLKTQAPAVYWVPNQGLPPPIQSNPNQGP